MIFYHMFLKLLLLIFYYKDYRLFQFIQKMSLNQQLYREYQQRKSQKIDSDSIIDYNHKRKQILKKLLTLQDDLAVNLQSSITLLRELSILNNIQNADHIITIMQNKKLQKFSWQGEQPLFNECRLIYFLWAVLQEETIQMRQFKQIAFLLINKSEKDRVAAIRQIYGDRQDIQELVQSFDLLFKANSSQNKKTTKNSRQFVIESYNSSDMDVYKDKDISEENISDISIIKSKNQNKYQDHQQQNQPHYVKHHVQSKSSTLKSKKYPHSYANNKQNILSERMSINIHKNEKNSNIIQYNKLNRSTSSSKMNCRSSKRNNIQNISVGKLKPFAFYSVSDNLSADQEKKLVERLYNIQKYKERQEQKKKIQQERIKIELNQCTFKPHIIHKVKIFKNVQNKQIKGYNKAIERMKIGYQKNKQLKQTLQYRIFKQPLSHDRITKPSAPKFVQRTKQTEVELFQIIFTIGRHNIRIKIKQSDKISEIVERLSKIYSLKEQYKESIRVTLQQQINKFYQQTLKRQYS